MPDTSPGNKKAKDDCPWLGALASGLGALCGTGSTQSRHIVETTSDHSANLADGDLLALVERIVLLTNERCGLSTRTLAVCKRPL